MENQQQERVAVRLFAGYQISAPLKYALERSSVWKNCQIDPSGQLMLVTRQGVEYLGVYVPSSAITLEKLSIIDEEVRAKLMEYCPAFNITKMTLQVFSQLFIH